MTTHTGKASIAVAALQTAGTAVVQVAGREVLVQWNDGDPRAWSSVCPHLGGPLAHCTGENKIRCAWHGYTFDAATGQCMTVVGGPWRQTGLYQAQEPPRLLLKTVACVVQEGTVWIGDGDKP